MSRLLVSMKRCAKCWVVTRSLALAVIGVMAVDCGASARDRFRSSGDHGTTRHDTVAREFAPLSGHVVSVLARGRLGGGASFMIVLIRIGTTYEVAFSAQGPARRRVHGKRPIVSYGGSSGVEIGPGLGEPLDLMAWPTASCASQPPL
jgi:hypothetical protein